MRIILPALFLLFGFVFASAASAQETREECISSTFSGPEYASLIYGNKCSEPIAAKVCSKFLVVELWTALFGDPAKDGWMCSGIQRINPGSTIDIRIVAVEESSLARKALAETSYRIFSCEFPYKPVIENASEGRYSCFLDPTDRAPNWDASEYERLTQFPIKAYDGTVMGFAPERPVCREELTQEIAAVFPDTPITADDVISEIRRILLGVTYASATQTCYMGGTGGPLLPFQFHAFFGQQKRFIINFSTRDEYQFPDYEGLKDSIEQALNETGRLENECSGSYENELVGFFMGKQSVSVDDVIESIRQAHLSPTIIERARSCIKENQYSNKAQFTYIGFSHPNPAFGKEVVRLNYSTGGLNDYPDFEVLREPIEQALREADFLQE